MPTNSDRVLAYLADHPEGQDDDQISEALNIDRIQINQICRRMFADGVVLRGKPASGGKIVNQAAYHPAGAASPLPLTPVAPDGSAPTSSITITGPMIWLPDNHAVEMFKYTGDVRLSEDQVKAALKQIFEAEGWRTEVRFGHVRGIDIEAIRDDERFVLEAKGEGISDPARGNYFDGALGELVRRMDAPDTRYGLALPAHRRFVRLVGRLPLWIRQRLGLWFFFVRPAAQGLEVGVFPPDGSYRSL